MSDHLISPQEAHLVLHKWVTEQIPIVAVFEAPDGSARVIINGFVNHHTTKLGLAVCTPFTKNNPIPGSMEFPDSLIAASKFLYADERQMPEHLEVGSGIRIVMPNGSRLTIMETSPSR